HAFRLIHHWARLASVAPRLANFLAQSPLFGNLGKALVGMALERDIPLFAEQNFKAWFQKRPAPAQNKAPVVLWPDTFNNYFHPLVAQAAVEVLEDAGFQVQVPHQDMCCGRPLYDYGMLDTAEKW